ncbi:adenine nucleotide alpha hydrolase family protein [Candidatus Woesearchaeota archaeon]|nr:adenine nucleotide alpha hydrolase family protein [Candidatus Woesearchaeota archaeon]
MIEKQVKDTIKKYHLIGKNDKVFVACSGGKDSTTALYLLKKLGYRPEALTINLEIGEWSKRNLENIKEFCEKEKIPLHVVEMKNEFGFSMCYIRSLIQKRAKLKNCTICGTIKRWLMNKKARELGATKLVTGHNLDDEAETTLMNFFKNNANGFTTMGPKTGIIDDSKFVQRIKPLYFCLNKDVTAYSKKMKFPVLYEKCPCSSDSFRRSIRNELDKMGPKAKRNIVNNLLKILPDIKKSYFPNRKLRYCSVCGEPSRNEVCKACSLINIIKEK